MPGPVVISPNLKKTSHRILPDGQIVDSQTKKVVGNVKEEEEYRPPVPVAQLVPQVVDPTPAPVLQTKSLADQIKEAEAILAGLKLLKKSEIEKKRKELEELEKL